MLGGDLLYVFKSWGNIFARRNPDQAYNVSIKSEENNWKKGKRVLHLDTQKTKSATELRIGLNHKHQAETGFNYASILFHLTSGLPGVHSFVDVN